LTTPWKRPVFLWFHESYVFANVHPGSSIIKKEGITSQADQIMVSDANLLPIPLSRRGGGAGSIPWILPTPEENTPGAFLSLICHCFHSIQFFFISLNTHLEFFLTSPLSWDLPRKPLPNALLPRLGLWFFLGFTTRDPFCFVWTLPSNACFFWIARRRSQKG